MNLFFSELKHQLEKETKQNTDVQRCYEEKLRHINEENEKLKALNESYQKEVRSLEIKLQTANKAKDNISEKLKLKETEFGSLHGRVSQDVGDYLVKIVSIFVHNVITGRLNSGTLTDQI